MERVFRGVHNAGRLLAVKKIAATSNGYYIHIY